MFVKKIGHFCRVSFLSHFMQCANIRNICKTIDSQNASVSCAITNRNARVAIFFYAPQQYPPLCRSTGVENFSKSADAAVGDASLTRI